MEAWKSGNQLWFVFRDLTSADTTYPSARFLYTDMPGPDGKLVMDFNRARNPPCAYNQWTDVSAAARVQQARSAHRGGREALPRRFLVERQREEVSAR
jgi:uncharacterized protein (DUF1684 family)